ncbi:DUF3526 domain-containing protein [Pedobacter lithocola]|uniref:DUF3526 domain-containing protein n=1 Tax=Pedobacter lithocola TaxID=1908239 RepID=A0ABV8PEC2_9SPHI
MLIHTVFTFEWKKVKMSSAFWIANALLFSIALIALINGRNIIRQQKDTIDKTIVKEKKVFDGIINQMHYPDTSSADKKWDYSKLTDPSWSLISPNKRWTTFWEPSASSFMAIGNRDVYPYYHEMEPFSFYMRFFKNEISSPFKLLFGNLDLAFVIIFLFPLFMIAFKFNIRSEEVESGTFALLDSTSSASKIINLKILFYLLSTLILLNGILLISVAYFDDLSLSQWLSYSVTANLYIIVWFLIIFLVVQLKKSSVQTAILLSTLWIFLSIGLPAIINSVANSKYPVSTEVFSKYIRRVQLNPEPILLKNRLSAFTKLYPQYKNTDTSDHLLFNKAYAVSGELSDREADVVLKSYLEQVAQRENFIRKWNFLNPVTQCQQSFTKTTQTDLTAFTEYLKSVRAFVQLIKEDLTNKYFTNQKMTVDDFNNRLSFKEYLSIKSTAKK